MDTSIDKWSVISYESIFKLIKTDINKGLAQIVTNVKEFAKPLSIPRYQSSLTLLGLSDYMATFAPRLVCSSVIINDLSHSLDIHQKLLVQALCHSTKSNSRSSSNTMEDVLNNSLSFIRSQMTNQMEIIKLLLIKGLGNYNSATAEVDSMVFKSISLLIQEGLIENLLFCASSLSSLPPKYQSSLSDIKTIPSLARSEMYEIITSLMDIVLDVLFLYFYHFNPTDIQVDLISCLFLNCYSASSAVAILSRAQRVRDSKSDPNLIFYQPCATYDRYASDDVTYRVIFLQSIALNPQLQRWDTSNITSDANSSLLKTNYSGKLRVDWSESECGRLAKFIFDGLYLPDFNKLISEIEAGVLESFYSKWLLNPKKFNIDFISFLFENFLKQHGENYINHQINETKRFIKCTGIKNSNFTFQQQTQIPAKLMLKLIVFLNRLTAVSPKPSLQFLYYWERCSSVISELVPSIEYLSPVPEWFSKQSKIKWDSPLFRPAIGYSWHDHKKCLLYLSQIAGNMINVCVETYDPLFVELLEFAATLIASDYTGDICSRVCSFLMIGSNRFEFPSLLQKLVLQIACKKRGMYDQLPSQVYACIISRDAQIETCNVALVLDKFPNLHLAGSYTFDEVFSIADAEQALTVIGLNGSCPIGVEEALSATFRLIIAANSLYINMGNVDKLNNMSPLDVTIFTFHDLFKLSLSLIAFYQNGHNVSLKLIDKASFIFFTKFLTTASQAIEILNELSKLLPATINGNGEDVVLILRTIVSLLFFLGNNIKNVLCLNVVVEKVLKLSLARDNKCGLLDLYLLEFFKFILLGPPLTSQKLGFVEELKLNLITAFLSYNKFSFGFFTRVLNNFKSNFKKDNFQVIERCTVLACQVLQLLFKNDIQAKRFVEFDSLTHHHLSNTDLENLFYLINPTIDANLQALAFELLSLINQRDPMLFDSSLLSNKTCSYVMDLVLDLPSNSRTSFEYASPSKGGLDRIGDKSWISYDSDTLSEMEFGVMSKKTFLPIPESIYRLWEDEHNSLSSSVYLPHFGISDYSLSGSARMFFFTLLNNEFGNQNLSMKLMNFRINQCLFDKHAVGQIYKFALLSCDNQFLFKLIVKCKEHFEDPNYLCILEILQLLTGINDCREEALAIIASVWPNIFSCLFGAVEGGPWKFLQRALVLQILANEANLFIDILSSPPSQKRKSQFDGDNGGFDSNNKLVLQKRLKYLNNRQEEILRLLASDSQGDEGGKQLIQAELERISLEEVDLSKRLAQMYQFEADMERKFAIENRSEACFKKRIGLVISNAHSLLYGSSSLLNQYVVVASNIEPNYINFEWDKNVISIKTLDKKNNIKNVTALITDNNIEPFERKQFIYSFSKRFLLLKLHTAIDKLLGLLTIPSSKNFSQIDVLLDDFFRNQLVCDFNAICDSATTLVVANFSSSNSVYLSAIANTLSKYSSSINTQVFRAFETNVGHAGAIMNILEKYELHWITKALLYGTIGNLWKNLDSLNLSNENFYLFLSQLLQPSPHDILVKEDLNYVRLESDIDCISMTTAFHESLYLETEALFLASVIISKLKFAAYSNGIIDLGNNMGRIELKIIIDIVDKNLNSTDVAVHKALATISFLNELARSRLFLWCDIVENKSLLNAVITSQILYAPDLVVPFAKLFQTLIEYLEFGNLSQYHDEVALAVMSWMINNFKNIKRYFEPLGDHPISWILVRIYIYCSFWGLSKYRNWDEYRKTLCKFAETFGSGETNHIPKIALVNFSLIWSDFVCKFPPASIIPSFMCNKSLELCDRLFFDFTLPGASRILLALESIALELGAYESDLDPLGDEVTRIKGGERLKVVYKIFHTSTKLFLSYFINEKDVIEKLKDNIQILLQLVEFSMILLQYIWRCNELKKYNDGVKQQLEILILGLDNAGVCKRKSVYHPFLFTHLELHFQEVRNRDLTAQLIKIGNVAQDLYAIVAPGESPFIN